MPTILSLHDDDGDENDLPPVLRAIAPGWTILSPRLTFDPQDLIIWLASHTTEPPCAFGYGAGADLAASILLNHPGTLQGAILLRPRSAPKPTAASALNGVPVLIATGAPGEADDLAQALSEAGARVDHAVQNCGPGLTPQDFHLARQFLARF